MASDEKVVALVVAAGSGSRAGGGIAKQFRTIGGKPLIAHALDRLSHPAIDEIWVMIGQGQGDLLQDAIGERSVTGVVTGGATRQESVRNGLEAIAAKGSAGIILIHDAARPFLPAEVIDRLLKALATADAAVPVLPVADTLALGGDKLGDIVPRDQLFRVQTPQAFRFTSILDAHRRWAGKKNATDDVQIARAAGYDVAVVAGDQRLEKITYDADFIRAERDLLPTMTTRTGIGFDVHQLADGEELWLGGIKVPYEKGLKGHSDADVVLHALTDAILGAAAEGDIGLHFPPSDPQWRNAPSSRFLTHARDLVLTRGGRIEHADLIIICEAPKIGPYRETMQERIAEMLGLPVTKVNVKATTTEHLGFTGRGEGIAAQAIVTLSLPEGQ